jgi:hypothetical protein
MYTVVMWSYLGHFTASFFTLFLINVLAETECWDLAFELMVTVCQKL